VGGAVEYRRFFRVRAPIGITTAGPVTPWSVFDALAYMDVNYETLLEESILICRAVPGAFSVKELFDMEYPKYEKVINIVRKTGGTNAGQ
jgi:hypothetical protein